MEKDIIKERNQYFDFLRGLAILMVIGIHALPSLTKIRFEGIQGDIIIIIRQLLNSAVPLFLAISGYFISQKSFINKDEYFSFIKKQIPKVYIPCLFWSVPFLLLSLRSGESLIISVLLFFLCGYSIYYFIALIIQYYILMPILKKIMGG